MANFKLLALLCLMFYYVDGVKVRLIGNDQQDMSNRLNFLKERRAHLEKEISKRKDPWEKLTLKGDLSDVKTNIAFFEASLKVPYEDYIRSTSEERQQFEREKEELRERLDKAEHLRIQANVELAFEKNGESHKMDAYKQHNLEKLTEERNELAREYAKFTEAYYEREQKIKEERDQFLEEKAKLQQLIDEVKEKHAQALEAAMTKQAESRKPFQLPEQDEINKLRKDITVFNGMKGIKELKEGLETTRKNLEELLERLYTKGGFCTQASHEDLESSISEMEKNTIRTREEEEQQRRELLNRMNEKDLTSYDDDELQALQKNKDTLANLDKFQKEIDRKSAYLNGVFEVSGLLKECTDAIRDANERNLAKSWVAKIGVTKDSPLTKFWRGQGNGAERANGDVETTSSSSDMLSDDARRDEITNEKSTSFSKGFKKALNGAKKSFRKISSGKEKSVDHQ